MVLRSSEKRLSPDSPFLAALAAADAEEAAAAGLDAKHRRTMKWPIEVRIIMF
jgi:hypothetical protein